jgi:hypothetical protein
MTITLTLYWWYLPFGLMLASIVVLWLGSRERGMFGRIFHVPVAFGLSIGALTSLITGWIAR